MLQNAYPRHNFSQKRYFISSETKHPWLSRALRHPSPARTYIVASSKDKERTSAMPSTPLLTCSNPLRVLRPEGCTRAQMAAKLHTSVPTIQFSELGCYLSIPTVYRPHLAVEGFRQYQEFRREKRQANFPDGLPQAATLQSLLTKLGLKPFQFADRFCVQPAEVWKVLNHPTSTYLPQNFLQGFIQVNYGGFS